MNVKIEQFKQTMSMVVNDLSVREMHDSLCSSFGYVDDDHLQLLESFAEEIDKVLELARDTRAAY